MLCVNKALQFPVCLCACRRICMHTLMSLAPCKLPTKCRFALLSLVSCSFSTFNADSGNLQHSPTGSSGQATIERPQGIAVLYQSSAYIIGLLWSGHCPSIYSTPTNFVLLQFTRLVVCDEQIETRFPSRLQLR